MEAQRDIHLLLQTALELLQARQYANAESLARQVLSINPDQYDALRLLGISAGRQGDFLTAVGWLIKAVQIGPESARAHHDLGLALAKLGQFEDPKITAISNERNRYGFPLLASISEVDSVDGHCQQPPAFAIKRIAPNAHIVLDHSAYRPAQKTIGTPSKVVSKKIAVIRVDLIFTLVIGEKFSQRLVRTAAAWRITVEIRIDAVLDHDVLTGFEVRMEER
ncbi:MAG: hypothetical protein O2960_26270 [Verrucomicrobia bacterium]|nr:hypothetical protein [Verrucomicrobiota bacterium]